MGIADDQSSFRSQVADQTIEPGFGVRGKADHSRGKHQIEEGFSFRGERGCFPKADSAAKATDVLGRSVFSGDAHHFWRRIESRQGCAGILEGCLDANPAGARTEIQNAFEGAGSRAICNRAPHPAEVPIAGGSRVSIPARSVGVELFHGGFWGQDFSAPSCHQDRAVNLPLALVLLLALQGGPHQLACFAGPKGAHVKLRPEGVAPGGQVLGCGLAGNMHQEGKVLPKANRQAVQIQRALWALTRGAQDACTHARGADLQEVFVASVGCENLLVGLVGGLGHAGCWARRGATLPSRASSSMS